MNAVFITAGHIDHGKTALVRALTGTNTDSLPEEARRGITIEAGFAPFCEGSREDIIVDVPGHEKLLHNMAASAGAATGAILAVDAREGVMPQTREHLAVLGLLGCCHGVIALTKCDKASRSEIYAATAAVKKLCSGSFLQDAAIIETSASIGTGIAALKAELVRLGELATEREVQAPFYMAIDRVFTKSGFGTIATGTALSGAVKAEDRLTLYPYNRPVALRGLAHGGKAVETGLGGMRLAINLAKIPTSDIKKGDVLCSCANLSYVNAFGASISLLPDVQVPANGTELQVCIGAKSALCRITFLGDNAFLRTAHPLCPRAGQRFLLRTLSPAATIGGGVVLCPICENPRRADGRERARIAAYATGLGDAILFEISRGGKSPAALNTLFFSYSPSLIQKALSCLEENKKIRLVKGEYIIYNNRTQDAKAVNELKVLNVYRTAGQSPPNFADLPSIAALPLEICTHCVGALCKACQLVRLNEAIYMDKQAFDFIVKAAANIIGATGGVTVAALRDALMLSRKYARAVLEYCDAEHIFINQGDVRVLP